MYEQSVNIKNPVEINLLFVQSRDGILNGTYPVTIDEACKVWYFRCKKNVNDNVKTCI